jgi:hypothetical protein
LDPRAAPLATTGLVEIVQHKLERLIERIVRAANPLDVRSCLILIPSLAMQAAVTARHAQEIDLSHLLHALDNLTRIALAVRRQKEHLILFETEIQAAVAACVDSWSSLAAIDIAPPAFDAWDSLVQARKASGTKRAQNLTIEPVPACQLPVGHWITPTEQGMSTDESAAGIRRRSDAVITRGTRARAPRTLPASGREKAPNRGRARSPVRGTADRMAIASGAQPGQSPSDAPALSDAAMRRAIALTAVSKPPEPGGSVDMGLYVPRSAALDEELSTQERLFNLAERLKGKKVDDLLQLELSFVNAGVLGKDGLKLSEPRVMALIDGTMDHPQPEGREEMELLQQFSLHFQSLLYCALSSAIPAFADDVPAPHTVCNTEVSILVDLNCSVTMLSPAKLMAAEILTAGLSISLSDFGVPISLFAFGDRAAIWRLTDPLNRNPSVELLRLVDAMRAGGRPGSYPLDAILSVETDWTSRRDHTSGTVQGVENHLTILISDCLSPQVLDPQRNWSSVLGLSRCVVLALDTEWNRQVLYKGGVDKGIYENGLHPAVSSADQTIQVVRLNPAEVCRGVPAASGSLAKVAEAVSSLIITKTARASPLTVVTVQVQPPAFDPVFAWARLRRAHVRTSIDTKDFFFQVQVSHAFPHPGDAGQSGIKVDIPSSLESLREWAERKAGGSGQTPFDGLAKDIATTALTHSFVPNVAAGKEPSTSSGELWIDGLRRFIASGYTYQYLFRKKSRRNQKAYAITIVLDSVRRLFSHVNDYHTLSTIAGLFGSLPLVPESDRIVVDVICASSREVDILMYGVPVQQFSEGGLISDVLRTLERSSGPESGIGSGCQAALQIAARRSGVGLGRRIFVLTDGIVSCPAQLNSFRSAITACASSGIDVLGIGLGTAPFHIPKIFPDCLYAPEPAELGVAMAAALGVSNRESAPDISSRNLYHQPDEEQMAAIENCLCKPEAPFCPGLALSIKEKPETVDVLDALGRTDLLINRNALDVNPTDEPYADGIFRGYRILIVCLYLGAYEKDNQITKAIFMRDCGRVLQRKGFDYTFVCSYGEGIAELSRNEAGRCPFTQLWLFSSPGYGDLPAEARDKDANKIEPFVRAVTDFWERGGGLFLFCDNSPYTFEANYLLEDFLTFSHDGKQGKTKVRFGGLPCTGESGTAFNGWSGKQEITVGIAETPIFRTFFPRVELPAPGQTLVRLSLRPGLVKFYEGNTISYAVDAAGKPITNQEDLWPFTAFAWTSEDVTPPCPFILFHDPKITSPQFDCRGPIVIHGGFTSAFYEFGDDKTGGTGRLIISIAVWLTRIEERLYQARKTAQVVKTVRSLTGNYTSHRTFEKFVKPITPPKRHSILCLDVSGSMNADYAGLAQGANDYIKIQREREGLISIIQFDGVATILYERKTREIGEREGFRNGINTDFANPLIAARELVTRSQGEIPQYESRIVFFTDGLASIPTAELAALDRVNVRMDVVGCGSMDRSALSKLVIGGGQLSIRKTIEDVQEVFRAIAAAD